MGQGHSSTGRTAEVDRRTKRDLALQERILAGDSLIKIVASGFPRELINAQFQQLSVAQQCKSLHSFSDVDEASRLQGLPTFIRSRRSKVQERVIATLLGEDCSAKNEVLTLCSGLVDKTVILGDEKLSSWLRQTGSAEVLSKMNPTQAAKTFKASCRAVEIGKVEKTRKAVASTAAVSERLEVDY